MSWPGPAAIGASVQVAGERRGSAGRATASAAGVVVVAPGEQVVVGHDGREHGEERRATAHGDAEQLRRA